MENCISELNYEDGFNYHSLNGYNPEFIEVNCIGRFNGNGNNTGINNGSTCHEYCRGIRLNGIYYGNEGRNVHDINDAHSWNVNCFAFDSVATTGDAAKEDFAAAMSAMAKLRPAVDAFFDKVKVNDDEPKVRENRLKLLNEIRAATRAVADFSKIQD
jgi:hypothetical protein